MVKNHGGYTEALEAISKAVSSPINITGGEVITAKSPLARYFVAHGGYENAFRTIRELQQADALQKLAMEDATKRTGIQPAPSTEASNTILIIETTAVPASPVSAPTTDASTNHDLIDEVRKHNCGQPQDYLRPGVGVDVCTSVC